MARYYRYFDPETQQFYLVDAENDIGPDPGIGIRRSRDLYSRLPDGELAGYTGPGVTPIGATPDHSQPKAVVIPTHRPLAGADENNRGAARKVTLSAGAPEQRVPSIVATPVKGGNDAEVIGVHLGLEYPDANFRPPFPVDITAIVEWGIGGTSFEAEVDWGQGTYFTVSASYVRISAKIAPTTPPAGLPGPFDILLKAGFSYGNSNTVNFSSPVRRTNRFDLGAGQFTNLIKIPNWALGTSIVSNALGAPNLWMYCYDAVGGTPLAVYKFVDNSNLSTSVEGQFPILRSFSAYRVFNFGMPVSGSVIFNLSL